jgi:hypothetical protein
MPTLPSHRADLLHHLQEELEASRRRGDQPSLEAWCARYPELADDLPGLFTATVRLKSSGFSPQPIHENTAPEAVLRQVGDYRIVVERGRGGMGIVFEAEQESLKRRVALKVLWGQSRWDETARQRFRREARSAASLHHTNIVPVFDEGEEEGVCYFYCTRFLEDVIVPWLNPIMEDQTGRDTDVDFFAATTGGAGVVGRCGIAPGHGACLSGAADAFSAKILAAVLSHRAA